MPKLKSHKGSKKVFIVRKNDIKVGKPGSRHNTGSKSTKFNRSCRIGHDLSRADRRRFKNLTI